METHLDDLLETIKRNGIDAAEKEAQKIVEKARQEAAQIIKDAEQKNADLLARTKTEIDKQSQSSEVQLQQSARNLMIAVRQEIVNLFGKILKQKIAKTIHAKQFAEIVVESIAHQINDNPSLRVDLSVTDAHIDTIKSILLNSVQDSIKDGLTIKPIANISEGFRISYNQKSSSFEVTHKTIHSALQELLTPKLKQLLEHEEVS